MGVSVLYLHGVGQGVTSDDWYRALADALGQHGIQMPSIDSRRTLRPSYIDLLQGIGLPKDGVKEPKPTGREPGVRAEKLTRRADYARRQAHAIADLPGVVTSSGFGSIGRVMGAVDPSKIPLPFDLPDAKRYLRSEKLRWSILHKVIDAIGTRRDLVVIGHSLGSLVAIDLLSHLPPDLHIRRLVTIGSPAGALGFHKARPDVLMKDFPFHHVGGWLNLFSPYDPATYGAGLSSLFPSAVDVRVDGGVFHAAHRYLAHPAVGKAVADPMQPISRRIQTSKGVDLPLDRAETDAMDAVRFAQFVVSAIRSEERQHRYAEAVLTVQQQVGSELIAMRAERGLPLPMDLVRLRDGQALPKLSHRDWDEQLLFAIVNATGNPIAPYEIKAEDEQLSALISMWSSGYGFTRADGKKIADAVTAAKEGVGGEDWSKLLVGALGIALIAAGPVGLMLAAPAGLAGGAAITASLAAFGPGGMVGGMALAGGLVGAGSAFTAGAAMPTNMSEAMVRTQVVRCLAFARAHHELGMPSDGYRSWHYLNSWRDQLTAEQERLSVLSDDSAPSLKSVGSKLKVVDKGLRWMVDNELTPALGGGEASV